MPNENMPGFEIHPIQPQQPRKTDMKVLCLGLSRTSTMSMYVALQKLGYKPYHMSEACMDWHNGSLKYWDEAIEAKYFNKGTRYRPKDFEKMLWKYDSVSDIPCVLFVDELLEAYPNAKVVLTTRDVDSWVKSVESIFYAILSWKRWHLLEIIDTQYIGHYIPIVRNALRVWTDDDMENREKLKEGFAKHYAHVRNVVPKDKLLEFHPKGGWEPLCRHLGKPVPNEPYPRINEGPWVTQMHYPLFWYRLCVAILGWGKLALPVVVIVGAAWWMQSKRT